MWVLTRNHLSHLAPGASQYITSPLPHLAPYSTLLEARDGHLWAVGAGLQQFDSVRGQTLRIAQSLGNADYVFACAAFDHDGNLFACRADSTIDEVYASAFQQPAAANAHRVTISGKLKGRDAPLRSILEDREGNVWVGSASGLIQIRSTAVVWQAAPNDSENTGIPILAATDGRLYAANRLNLEEISPDGSSRVVAKVASAASPIDTICPDRQGGVWIGSVTGFRHWTRGSVRFYPSPLEWKKRDVPWCAVDRGGDLWASVDVVGAFRYHAGVWQRVVLDQSHPGSWPHLMTDANGRVLAFAQFQSVWRSNGARMEWVEHAARLNVGFIRTVQSWGSDLLVTGDYGIALFDGRNFRYLTSDRHPWLSTVGGVVQTPAGDTWLNGAQGIARVRTADLHAAFSRPNQPIRHELFGLSDGLQGSVSNSSDFRGAVSRDGAVVFQTDSGRAWIDPRHLQRSIAIPPVVIKSITANGKTYLAKSGLVLPAHVRSLQIDYAALSLVNPQRNQFRYRLRGVDSEWINPGGRRQAFYTNLNPGEYDFDVIASNSDGVWNKTGATLRFRIRPAFWQTSAFSVAMLLVISALLSMAYSLRLRELAKRIQSRLEERLAERERIARELHDTLLQGFQALTLQFQAVADQMPPADSTRVVLEAALEQADRVLVEGRDRVKDLRANRDQGELADRIEAVAHRLRLDPDVAIVTAFQGRQRPVHPVVSEELLAISSEALFNAFRHARATRVTVGLAWERRGLILLIADNGTGLDPSILRDQSRPGHYGLTGMRERARKLKTALQLRTSAKGTEVQVLVPAAIAYARPARRERNLASWRLNALHR